MLDLGNAAHANAGSGVEPPRHGAAARGESAVSRMSSAPSTVASLGPRAVAKILCLLSSLSDQMARTKGQRLTKLEILEYARRCAVRWWCQLTRRTHCSIFLLALACLTVEPIHIVSAPGRWGYKCDKWRLIRTKLPEENGDGAACRAEEETEEDSSPPLEIPDDYRCLDPSHEPGCTRCGHARTFL